MMDTDTDFRDILRNEGRFAPSNALIDKLLMYSEEIRLKPGGVLIGYGQTDTNIYIVKEGIIQLLYFKGEKEVTFGFAFPGTIMCSPQSVYMNHPSVMQIESCRIASSVLRISKAEPTFPEPRLSRSRRTKRPNPPVLLHLNPSGVLESYR